MKAASFQQMRSRALAHQDPDQVRRAYARGVYWADRVEMAQWWADFLDTLKENAKTNRFSKATMDKLNSVSAIDAITLPLR